MKTKTLTIPVYETPAGAPTCLKSIEKGEICRFLRTQRMGQEMTCLFGPQSGKRGEPLEDNVEGYLVPSPACPFHSAPNTTHEPTAPETKPKPDAPKRLAL